MIYKRNHHPAAPPSYAMACEVTTAVMAVAAVVSAAVGTYSAVQQGEAAKAQGEFVAKQKRDQEEALRTAALQEEAARREELASHLSTIDAIRAGRGLNGMSPTALVLRDDITNDAMDEMRITRLNILNGAESARQSAIQAQRQGEAAESAGWVRGVGSLLDMGSKAAGIYGGGSTYVRSTAGTRVGVWEPLTGRRSGGPV